MPLVTYSALRVALLGACFALGYWAGLRMWLLLLVATFAAWGLSYVLLQGPRDAAALYLAERSRQRAAGAPRSADPDAAHEDAVVDAVVDAAQPPAGPGDLRTRGTDAVDAVNGRSDVAGVDPLGDDAGMRTHAAAPETRPRDDRPGTGSGRP